MLICVFQAKLIVKPKSVIRRTWPVYNPHGAAPAAVVQVQCCCREVQCRCRPGCHLGRQQQELLLMPLSSSLLPSLSVSAASLLHNHLSSTTFSCSCSFSPVSEKKSVSKCQSQRVLTSRASSTGQLCSCPVYRLVSCACSTLTLVVLGCRQGATPAPQARLLLLYTLRAAATHTYGPLTVLTLTTYNSGVWVWSFAALNT